MKSVIYIDRNSIWYYGNNVHTPVSFLFPKEIVTDLEIINKSELSKQIYEWIKAHKIEPSAAIILLANNIYFQKEIPDATPSDKHTEIKKLFVENIPFNETYIQEILVGKSTVLIGINTDFVYSIRDIFYSHGFTIEAISPVAEVYGLQPVGSFSVLVAQEALKKISKDNGIPLHTIIDTANTSSEDILPKAQSNQRLYIMLTIFFILISILGILFYFRRKPKKIIRKPPTPVVLPITSPTTLPPSIEISSIASPEASIAKDEITIQILNGSGIPGQADTIKKILLEKGFDNITTGNAITTQTSRSLIIFKKSVSKNDQNEITKAVEVFVNDYIVQQKDDIAYDILITTSQGTVTPSPY